MHSDHCLSERIKFHTCLASTLATTFLTEEAGGEVDLCAANSHDCDKFDERHPALTSRSCISN